MMKAGERTAAVRGTVNGDGRQSEMGSRRTAHMDLLTAILLTIVLAITPSVLFLLFWRFLVSLRDDALLERLHAVHGIDASTIEFGDVLPVPTSAGSVDVVNCSGCGSATVPIRGRCPSCGRRAER